MTHRVPIGMPRVVHGGRDQADLCVRLVSVDPSRNRFRFYTLTCEQTLWREWAIRSRWGRIGGVGRSRVVYLGPAAGRASALGLLVDHRLRRGYLEAPVPRPT